jgi:multicomponent Na+:H+ antiporter subunit E
MIGYLDLILRLSIWFLLTGDIGLANTLVGFTVSLILPRPYSVPAALGDWLKVIWEILVAIPQAYFEAIEMIFSPHLEEEITLEQVKPNRTPGLIFLDIFLITFTPKSIVLKYHQNGWYEVHWIRRRK